MTRMEGKPYLERAALSDLKAELVQVAAVAVAWAEAIDTELGGAS